MKKSMRGLSLTGFAVVLIVVCSLAFLGMKLFPIYSEYHSVVTSLKGLANEPGIAGRDANTIRTLLQRRFEVSYVTSVRPEDIVIRRANGGGTEVEIVYEVRTPLMFNIDLVVFFEKVQPLRPGEVE